MKKQMTFEECIRDQSKVPEKHIPTKDELITLLNIAKECNCGCHKTKSIRHFMECCQATYMLIVDLETQIKELETKCI